MTSDKKQNILVTGGGGFLGGAIVARLVEKGETVVSFSRGRYQDLENLGIEQIQGDLSNPADVDKAVEGRDIVFHVAAKPGVWGKFDEYFRPNVLGTRNIISACKKFKVPRLIYTSSPSVVFDGTDMEGVDESAPYPQTFHTPYTQTKATAEQEVLAAAKEGLPVITLRPHLIWGPRDPHLVPRIIQRAGRLVRIGRKENKVDTIYVDNAVDAHLAAADKLAENPELAGNVYFISNDEPIPLWDIINGILNAGSKPPIKKTLPHSVVWSIGAILEFVYKTFRLTGEPKMTRFVADEMGTAHWFDISAAKNDLGYVPEVSIKEGLKRLEIWLEENPVA